jgi:hypothetical protein
LLLLKVSSLELQFFSGFYFIHCHHINKSAAIMTLFPGVALITGAASGTSPLLTFPPPLLHLI